MRISTPKFWSITAVSAVTFFVGAGAATALPDVEAANEPGSIATFAGQEVEGNLALTLAEQPLAAASEAAIPYRIVFDGEGRFSEAVKVDALMPEGVVIDGREIDVSGLVARPDAAPLEGNPQWFMELEETPRVGMDVRLTGDSVVEYPEDDYGPVPVLLDPVRVVQQGHPDSSVLLDGTEVTGCYFVGHNTVGRQVSTSLTEVAYDPATCKRVVEIGIVVQDLPASDPSSADDSGGGSPGKTTEPGAFRLEVPDFRAKTRSQVRELAYPVLPAVVEVNAQVEVWNQKPQYSPSKWAWWSSWLQSTGWGRLAGQDTWHGWSANNIYVGEASDYANDEFCPGTTWAGATTQTIGYANMTVDHFASVYKSGACSWLLRTNQTNNFWWINAT